MSLSYILVRPALPSVALCAHLVLGGADRTGREEGQHDRRDARSFKVFLSGGEHEGRVPFRGISNIKAIVLKCAEN